MSVVSDSISEVARRLQNNRNQRYPSVRDWVNSGMSFLDSLKKDSDYKTLFDLWEMGNVPIPSYMNVEWSLNVQMYEFRTISNIFVSKLTASNFRNTHHQPYAARKFIISLHSIDIILSKYLLGVDLDELKRIGPYLYTYEGKDMRTGVIIYAQADNAFFNDYQLYSSFQHQLDSLHHEFKGDLGCLCLYICNTYDQYYTVLHVGFYVFMRKYMAQRYNPCLLLQKFFTESNMNLEWTPKTLKFVCKLYRQFLGDIR